MTDQTEIYRDRYVAHLSRVAALLENLIRDHLRDVPRVDHVSARAKDPEHFAEKASRLADDGNPKYQAPLTEIQDQIGARVTVFYLDTVEVVSTTLEQYLRPIEEVVVVPDSSWEFGYFGKHYIMALPQDVVPRDVPTEEVPQFFELQIKTLFQHAWSEANHDLGYKGVAALSNEQQRRLAFASAQAWGADEAFEVLQEQLRAGPQAN